MPTQVFCFDNTNQKFTNQSMNLRSIFLIVLLNLICASVHAEKYEGLKVLGNYKELPYLIEYVRDNNIGLTRGDVESLVKLRLLSAGIKPIKLTGDYNEKHYLYVVVNCSKSGNAYSNFVHLEKYSIQYGVPSKYVGISFTPSQGAYSIFGTAGGTADGKKNYILGGASEIIDIFLLDYLESNLEVTPDKPKE